MNKFSSWLDKRLPIFEVWRKHFTEYYVPKNFNFWYYFGFLAIVVLVMQLVTGIFLAMNYKPDTTQAFNSVEFIMRDVNWGWLIRYMHSTGASAFFIVVYLHMFKGIIYGSYRSPRELLWLIGVFLFLLLLAEAVMGYTLPWGQMSYWGIQVVTSFFTAIPVVGDSLSLWIRGDYVASGVTLNRLFALHVIAVPLMLIALVYIHIVALHKVGSNNPDGIEIKDYKDKNGIPLDGIPSHPYYTVKNLVATTVFLIIFAAIVFFFPDMWGYFLEKDNFLAANSLKTPAHIAPSWYMTPFYAILRAIPNKLMGVLAMVGSIGILAFLPWLDRSPVKSIRYRGWIYKIILTLFVIAFLTLGYIGMHEVSPINNIIARIAIFIYFAFFILMPIYTKYDKTKTPPTRLT